MPSIGSACGWPTMERGPWRGVTAPAVLVAASTVRSFSAPGRALGSIPVRVPGGSVAVEYAVAVAVEGDALARARRNSRERDWTAAGEGAQGSLIERRGVG